MGSTTPTAASVSPKVASTIVWVIWAGLSAIALFYVYHYGTNVPSWDDWDIVPTMTGEQPVTLSWLWSQHNEHRIPIARLIMLGTYRVWPDFRATMVLNVTAMALLAFALTRTAIKLRGAAALSDVLFSLVLLGLAQGVNFIWGWQIEFMSSTAFAGFALICIALYSQKADLQLVVAFGFCVVLLALSGAHGLALVPAFAAWLLVIMAAGGKSHPAMSRRDRLVVAGICFVCFALCAGYMIGYERVPHHPKSTGVPSALLGALQCLTMAFGPAIQSTWPWSGWLTAILMGGTALLLVRAAMASSTERVRALGYLCFLAAFVCLAVAIGYGRDKRGFEPRYITLSAPILCAAYLALLTYLPRRAAQVACAVLALLAVCAIPANFSFGIKYARDLRNNLRAFEKEMIAGTFPSTLIQRHWPYLYPQQQLIMDYLPMLRKAGIGKFSKLAMDPSFREIGVTRRPASLHKMQWRDFTAYGQDWESYAVFPLAGETAVAGIRIAYNATNQRKVPPFVKLEWRSAAGKSGSYTMWPTGDQANWQRGSWIRIGQSRTQATVWIGAPMNEIRLYPDIEPCQFQLEELVILVPE